MEVLKMKENYLLYFDKPINFFEFLKDIEYTSSWKIESGLFNTRGSLVSSKVYFKSLKQLFIERNIFRMKPSIAEIISWLDSFVHISRLLKMLESSLDKNIYEKIEIYFEYVIPMTKGARIDVILKFKKTYFILETTCVDKFEKMKNAYNRKGSELLIYKEYLKYNDHEIKVFIYPLISIYEYHKNQLLDKHQKYNVKNIEYLKNYIINFLK
jgi:hypothetical protein